VAKDGKRKLLVVNQRNRDFEIAIPGAAGGRLDRVDVRTRFQAPASSKLTEDKLTLHGFYVAVITLP